ncbi:ribosome biogenesis protein kri1 [Niveomyces insectorum RCEF 264]|uniref:Ribosome biogenesis protein kri1 n=1 Tax=Niveomyces insectorum RCEF 264 TaxID=1081102 RepID=A0A167Y1T2_9HYPO|nr:ribosome biogenesis protein kri1 [Niveomyces insectorum RCEF 264]
MAAGKASSGLSLSKNPKKRLFEDDEDDDRGEKAVSSDNDASSFGQNASFTVNEEYARRFEHNKKREEKQKLEEKYGKSAADDDSNADSDDSEDDESEDEDGYLLTEELDARMSAALQAIKNKDPRIYDTDVKFFDPAEAEKAAAEEVATRTKDTKEKPLFLHDYHRERYLRGDTGADDDHEMPDVQQPKTYQQEQDELKRALIAEMNAAEEEEEESESDEDGGAKIVKKTTRAADNDDQDDVDAFIKPKATTRANKEAAAAHGVHPARADRIRISEADVANADRNPELFLSNFLASRAWVPEDDEDGSRRQWQAFESDDDDDAERDRAEVFETAYNLRFEDPDKSNEVLKSYSRTVVAERSVRREAKTARQRQREERHAQKAAEKEARRAERARLRKLRIEDAQAKLAKIQQAAGLVGRTLDEEEWTRLLDDAWDNDAWEANMQKQFGDAYYAEPDTEVHAGLSDDGGEEDGDANEKTSMKKKNKKKLPKKPKWDDDIDIKDIVPDFDDKAVPNVTLTDSEEEATGHDGAGEKDAGEGVESGSDDSEEEAKSDDNGDDGGEPSAKRRKTGKQRKQERTEAKRATRRTRARIEALVDRQLAIDDPVATLAAEASSSSAAPAPVAGFRYRETSPQTFGLTAHDILLAPSDAALNEFAGLKKLATFRDEERKRRDRKKLGKKARLRQWRRETFGADYEQTGPTYGFERFVDEDAGAGEYGAKAAAQSSSASSAAKHHKSTKKKSSSKGKDERADAGEAEPAKKKRKRSGRKHKGKDNGEAVKEA